MIKKSILPWYYGRLFFLRSAMYRLIALSMLFSCSLVLVRVFYTGRLTFVFLIWNLVLAFFPFLISELLAGQTHWTGYKIKFLFFFLLWLVFIPNSFYILTDLYHLGDNYNDYRVPDWFDLAMIISFAWNGLLLGILSLRQMEKTIRLHFFKMQELLFIYPIMWLNALGVYMGRCQRFNSWDLFTDPFQIIRGIMEILIHPGAYRYASGMIYCFSIWFTIFYVSLKRMAKNLR